MIYGVGVHFHESPGGAHLKDHFLGEGCLTVLQKAPSRSKPLGVNVQGVYESSYHVPLLEVHICSSFS